MLYRALIFTRSLLLGIFFCGGMSVSSPAETVTLGEDASLLSGIPGQGDLTEQDVEKWLDEDANHEELSVKLPRGLAAGEANIFSPLDNPITRAKVELGRQLFFDSRLSSDNSVSCATCHQPDSGFSSGVQDGIVTEDQVKKRNASVIYNRILSKAQFWDGRADSLDTQVIGPIENAIGKNDNHKSCSVELAAITTYKTLSEVPLYKTQFEKIFADGLNIDNVGKALASFQRAIVTGPAPYDYRKPLQQFEIVFAEDLDDMGGDDDLKAKYEELQQAVADHPMSDAAVRGMQLFVGKAQCTQCHSGANFTDEQYHNLGVGMDREMPDLGRYKVTMVEKDKGAFKTPTLRNVSMSAPYMHDGSQKTLEEVAEWHNKGGQKNPWRSDKLKKLDLNDQEKQDLVAFMKEGLAGKFPAIESGRLPPANADAMDDDKMEEKTANSTARGFLGVRINEANLQICEVKAVYPDGAADIADLKKGDVIVGIDKDAITSFDTLKMITATLNESQVIVLKIKRGDEEINKKVTLQKIPGS